MDLKLGGKRALLTGSCSGITKRVASAVGEGSIAVAFVHKYSKR
jgi:hypothetical protein